MTSLANMDMPKGRGKKANKATQKRKGPANAPKKPIVETYVSSTNSTAGLHYFQPTESIAGNSAAATQQPLLSQNPCSATQVLLPITTQFQSNNPAATATTMTIVAANVSNTNSTVGSNMPSQLHHFQPARAITGTPASSHQQPLPANSCPSVSSLQHMPTRSVQSNNPTATTMITMIPTQQELPQSCLPFKILQNLIHRLVSLSCIY
ncbi:Hypothetical predicted protein [Paramuricea clavata]|uniref:Uncharacterized protein n=1 Tax=Paramuricea clavata TaxID=317549 RepID=A0A7D9I661_PARCT|nr:Hypothetical predicted protein [Paramuricea clavata]